MQQRAFSGTALADDGNEFTPLSRQPCSSKNGDFVLAFGVRFFNRQRGNQWRSHLQSFSGMRPVLAVVCHERRAQLFGVCGRYAEIESDSG